MPLLSHVALLCLFLFLVVLFPAPGQGAVALNHHQLKMHVEWNRAVEREDWTDWNAAFAMADLGDGNSHGHVHEVAKVRTARPGITGRRCNCGMGWFGSSLSDQCIISVSSLTKVRTHWHSDLTPSLHLSLGSRYTTPPPSLRSGEGV